MRAARRVGFVSLLSLLGVASPALAQTTGTTPTPPRLDRSFDVQLFHPAVGAQSFITLDSAEVLEHKLWHVGLLTNYERRPFTYSMASVDDASTAGNVTLAPVQNLSTAELVFAMGLFGRFEVGAALPLALTWDGDIYDSYGRTMGATANAVSGIGDLRVEGKSELVGFGHDRPFLLSLSVGATLPTGDENAFMGEKNVTGRARALLEYQRGDRLRAVAMLGGMLREESRFLGTPMGNAMLYGAAVEVHANQQIALLGEITGRFASKYDDTNPAEFDAAMRFYLPSALNLIMGAGLGLNQGIGSPTARLFVGLGWAPDLRDRDHDGIPDVSDRCPDEPEDKDGFQDDDGCPDPDNDGDGIPDTLDKCPNEPEDFDGFQDDDGCPDPDNDGDGIPDIMDACPNEKEDGKGKRPNDGCPSSAEDSDGDGIPDVKDKCPDEPEDKDGFQDDDGCPDYDNDGDGIPDAYDACPNEPEDFDGFEDSDGCPDPDNDHDGIPDVKDKCPNQPETINYYKDEDGCPDPPPPLVSLGETDDKVYLAEHINFFVAAGGKPQLTMNSHMMVALVARVILGHPEIAMVRIDVRGKDATKEQTQERGEVVKAELVKDGFDAQKLKVAGLGPGPSRVEFVIESRSKSKRNPPPIPSVDGTEGSGNSDRANNPPSSAPAPEPAPDQAAPGTEPAPAPATEAPATEAPATEAPANPATPGPATEEAR